jgi:hypothetical protein
MGWSKARQAIPGSRSRRYGGQRELEPHRIVGFVFFGESAVAVFRHDIGRDRGEAVLPKALRSFLTLALSPVCVLAFLVGV